MEHLLNPVRGFAATTVAAVAAALVVGAWMVTSGLAELDQLALGSDGGHFTVSEIEQGTSRAAISDILADTAKREHVNIALTVPDIDGHRGEWDFYEFVGDPSNQSLAERPFDDRAFIAVHPASAITVQDLRGSYATTATGVTLDSLVRSLRAQGIVVTPFELDPRLAPLLLLEDPGRQLVTLVTVVGVGLAIASEALRRRRRQAVRRTVGWSGTETTLRELGDITRLVVGLIALASVGGLVGLWFYNGFAGLGRLAAQLALVWPATAIAVIGFHLLAMARPPLRKSAELFAGAAPGAVRRLGPVVAQGALVIIAIVGLSGLGSAMTAVTSVEKTLQHQAPLAPALKIALGLNGTNDESIQAKLGAVVRSQLTHDSAVLAGYDRPVPHGLGLRDNYVNGQGGSNHLWANRAYLEHEPLLDDRGRALTLPSSNQGILDLLIPRRLADERPRIEADFRQWLTFQREIGGTTSTAPRLRVTLIADGQQTPNFADDEGPVAPRIGNVVAVLPDDAGVASLDFLATSAGNGQIVFTDPARLRSEIDRAGITGAIVSYDRFGDNLTRQIVAARGSAERLVFAAVATVVVLGFATWISVRYHGERHRIRRRVFALTGRSPWAVHGQFLVLSTAVSVVAVVLALVLANGAAVTITAAAALCLTIDCAMRLIALTRLTRSDRRLLGRAPRERDRKTQRRKPRRKARHAL